VNRTNPFIFIRPVTCRYIFEIYPGIDPYLKDIYIRRPSKIVDDETPIRPGPVQGEPGLAAPSSRLLPLYEACQETVKLVNIVA